MTDEEAKKLVCPVMSKFGDMVYCKGSDCAWWNISHLFHADTGYDYGEQGHCIVGRWRL